MSEKEPDKRYVCQHCGVPMEEGEVSFKYLKFNFSASIPRCPKCGMICVPEELAKGKMKEVEMMLEDK